jgi:hypothetical protein
MIKKTVQPRKKKRGPPATGKGTPVQVRMQPAALAALDKWRASQKDHPSRPEGIRRVLDKMFGEK